jgi:predicted transcriptional regulator
MTSCLLETLPNRKNKISLTDYNYQKDIENRLVMAQFTSTDLTVLEEILYSSIQIPLEKLCKNTEKSLDEILPSLQKFAKTGLVSLEKDTITVDKEMRKYFEFQIEKFDEEFKPGMDFLQSLLKKPPIHILPIWYSIPRTSNNIFESLLEKYLQTPQIFQRYIMELNFGEPVLKNIIQDIYTSENFCLSSAELMQKYNISRELFEEYMLHLEFSFVCCLGYRKSGDVWEEVVTPFQEWKEYLSYLKNSEVSSIKNPQDIILKRPSEFSFVQDLAILLEACKKKPIPLENTDTGYLLPKATSLRLLLPQFPALSKDPEVYQPYIHHLIAKAQLLRLCDPSQSSLQATEAAEEWLSLRLDHQALYLYRHPKNRILNEHIPPGLYTEKALRESEKSIVRALQADWVLFDDFFRGIHAPLSEELAITLKKTGKHWEYALPKYSENETLFLREIILQWLFEAGIVQVGTLHGKDCFRVTTLGQTLFAR